MNEQSTTENDERDEREAEALQEQCEAASSDEEKWCPNCRDDTAFTVVGRVKRPEFDVENEIHGCVDCHYSFINQNTWRPITGDAEQATTNE